jgi:hypothetical protein
MIFAEDLPLYMAQQEDESVIECEVYDFTTLAN